MCRMLVTLCMLGSTMVGGAGVAAEASEPPAPPRPYLMVDVMAHFQRFADKLYFSGKAQNWPLAGGYLWKLEQAALPVIEGRVEVYRSDRFDAQPLMKAMLIPGIRAVGDAIEKKDAAAFARSYSGLVDSCNACHAATDLAVVKIVVPTTPIYTNQDYSP